MRFLRTRQVYYQARAAIRGFGNRLRSHDPDTLLTAWAFAAGLVALAFLVGWGYGTFLTEWSCQRAALPYLGEVHGGRCYVNTDWAALP